jgi:O-methyltransferase
VNSSGTLRRLYGQFRQVLAPSVDRSRRLDGPATIEDLDIWNRVSSFTMTSPARVQALVDAVRYLERHRIPGSFVECGVWRGGSMMAAALTLLETGASRELFLFDTFEGMPPPGSTDVDHVGRSAADLLAADPDRTGYISAVARLDEVRRNLAATGYPTSKMHFVVGRVEDTVPARAPDQIALLRLDTDWYESTRHELEHLLPRVVSGGVLIVDDYGHWRGAKQAVDEYLHASGARILLNRVDYTGRIAIIP